MLSGMGISTDGNDLYVVMASKNKVGVVRNVNTPSASFEYICGLNEFDPLSSINEGASSQSCSLNAITGNTNPCMLLQPSDVVAVSSTLLYVTYYQGITQIDLSSSTARCLQVAGLANDLSVTQKTDHRDGIMVSNSTVGAIVTDTNTIGDINAAESTLLNYPYRLSFSLSKGSIYVADYYNYAVRRFYVQPQCACAGGFVPIAGINSCYNPSPNWDARPLPRCEPGIYSFLNTKYACPSNIHGVSNVVVFITVLWRQAFSRWRARQRARIRALRPLPWYLQLSPKPVCRIPME